MKKNLPVPFVNQINETACAAAVLEMVYSFLGLKEIFQEDIFNKYATLATHGNIEITVENMVEDANSRGLISKWNRVNYNNVEESIFELNKLVKKKEIPIIVCQQYTKGSIPGHFRVVINIDKKFVYYHDPCKKYGGKNLKMRHKDFIDYWQPTGGSVTGGVYVLIEKVIK